MTVAAMIDNPLDVWTARAQLAANAASRLGLAWHVTHCVGQTDKHALRWLDECDFETYYPYVWEMKNVPQRELTQSQRNSPLPIRRPRKTALFPRYAFVRFDMGKSGWREIFKFSGVAGMICAGQLPIAVPDEWIEAMKAQEVNGIVPGKIPAKKVLSFQIGDTARVIEGPFTGFNVVVDSDLEVAIEDLDPGMRIRVLVSMLGQMVKTHLEIAQLESV